MILPVGRIPGRFEGLTSSLRPGRPKKGYGIDLSRRAVRLRRGSIAVEHVGAEELACPSL